MSNWDTKTGRTRSSSLWLVPTSWPKHAKLYLLCILTLVSAVWEMSRYAEPHTHTKLLLLSLLYHPQSYKTNMAIRNSEEKSIIYVNHLLNKHDTEHWLLNWNLIKGRQNDWIPYPQKEQNCFCFLSGMLCDSLTRHSEPLIQPADNTVCDLCGLHPLSHTHGDQTNKGSVFISSPGTLLSQSLSPSSHDLQ